MEQTQSGHASAHPGFEVPYIDIDEERDLPVRHRYVHGLRGERDTLLGLFPAT